MVIRNLSPSVSASNELPSFTVAKDRRSSVICEHREVNFEVFKLADFRCDLNGSRVDRHEMPSIALDGFKIF